jgi:hypothetical protein
MFGARSRCEAWIPVSITATVTELLPVVTSKAAGPEIVLNPQASGKPGSFGISDTR